MGQRGGGHFGFGPLWTHLEGRRRDLPPLQICIYFPSLSSIFCVAFLMPPFHQIPSDLMFKVISCAPIFLAVCVCVCVDGVNRLRVCQLHWKSDEGKEKEKILSTKSLDWFDRPGPCCRVNTGRGPAEVRFWSNSRICRVIQGSGIIKHQRMSFKTLNAS